MGVAPREVELIVDERDVAPELDGQPLSDAQVDAAVEPDAVALELVQVLRGVHADIDLPPGLRHFVAGGNGVLRQQLLGLVVDRRVLIGDVGGADPVGDGQLAPGRFPVGIQAELDGRHEPVP
jgi:hypothetical protein